MRILFAVPSSGWLGYCEPVLVELADRGHDLYIAAESSGGRPASSRLASHPRVRLIAAPATRNDPWRHDAFIIRSIRAYLQSLSEPFAAASQLRRRAANGFTLALARLARGRTPSAAGPLTVSTTGARRRPPSAHALDVIRVSSSVSEAGKQCQELLLGMGEHARANLEELLRHVEDAIPTDAGYDDFIDRTRPDVVLLTPLVGFTRTQTDLVKSAQAVRVPVGLIMYSWDNLTTKGILHVVPNRVFVWNDVQAVEAETLHHVSRDRIVVTGTPRFDQFFELQPQTSRQEMCNLLGFDPSQPIVLYAGSSKVVIDDEVSFAARWLEEIRRLPCLQRANVLIRPHPKDDEDWSALHSPAQRTAVVPSSPATAEQSLFDALHHSSVVVGLNTSVALEAAIVGKPVVTIDALAKGQLSSVHFWYLVEDRGGIVRLSKDFDMHRRDLADVLAGADTAAIRRFVERFVRPLGIDRPVGPILADAVEAWVEQAVMSS